VTLSKEKKEKKEVGEIQLTPAEWARAGQVKAGQLARNIEGRRITKHVEAQAVHGVQLREGESLSAQYACADALFGWSLQAHHFGADSFRLSKSDFEKALLTALDFPCSAPHAAAIPPFSKDKFKAFKPKKKAG